MQREERKRTVKKNKLANEIRDNYISISNGITNMIPALYEEYNIKKFILEDLLDKEALPKRFGQIVLDIYSMADDVNNYDELEKIVFKHSSIDKISKKYLNEVDYRKLMLNYKNSIYYFNEEYDLIKTDKSFKSFFRGQEGGFIDIFKELKRYSKYNYIDLIILGLIIDKQNDNIGCINLEEEKKLKTKNIDINPYGMDIDFYLSLSSWDDEIKDISCFIKQFFYAHIFVYYIIFLRKVKKFRENEELMYILNNIEKENEEVCQVLLKFYPIYISFYENAFEDKLTVHEIETLIIALKNKEKFDSLIEFNYYQNPINDFKIDKDFKKLIDSIDKNIFMKYHSINDFSIVNNQEYFYNELFDYIIMKTIKYLDGDETLNIIFNKPVYIDRLKKNDELREILKNKNKYLHNIKEEKK